MKNKIRVLVSDLPLPFQGIGSWTFEFNYFLQKFDFFDYILSPNTNGGPKNIFSIKRKRFKGSYAIRQDVFLAWLAKKYISEIEKLGKRNLPLQILVIDDQTLLTAICGIKSKLPKGSEIIFYYHGHALSLMPSIAHLVDKVFFLTKAGYLESLKNNNEFTPEVQIIGNGVSSELFHPLPFPEKNRLREKFGFQKEDKIICWMANSRPVKGIHLFAKMIPELLQVDPQVKIITIGAEPKPEWQQERVFQMGRLNSVELSKYLQLSDFYFFTSLWKEGFGLSLIEAIKCGNFILCSDNGGIKDVVSGYEKVHLIETPNIIQAWIEAFKIELSQKKQEGIKETALDLANFYSLDAWANRLKDGLK